jgi:hypothetical protein
MSAIYISRLVDAGTPVSWSDFLPSAFPQLSHRSLQNWSLHPREPFDSDRCWGAVADSHFPRIEFYLQPTQDDIKRALDIYSSIGERIGSWGGCECSVTFASDPVERWDYDHKISISRMRFRTDEPSLSWFSFGPHMWDHSSALAQADYWNQWAKQFSLPIEFFVSEGILMRRVENTEAVRKLAEREGPVKGVEMVQKVASGFGCPTENPPLAKWFEAFWDLLDSRCKELRKVVIDLWHHQLPPEMTREAAMQRLLSEALPHISGTIWNKWTINGFVTKLEGLATLQAYSGPDDQHTVELADVELVKGKKARLFLLIEKAGMRLAVESRKEISGPVFDKLERESGFRFYRTPARERPAPTTYTLSEKQFLPPEGTPDDPGPEVPFDLKKWTEDFHALQSLKATRPVRVSKQ